MDIRFIWVHIEVWFRRHPTDRGCASLILDADTLVALQIICHESLNCTATVQTVVFPTALPLRLGFIFHVSGRFSLRRQMRHGSILKCQFTNNITQGGMFINQVGKYENTCVVVDEWTTGGIASATTQTTTSRSWMDQPLT